MIRLSATSAVKRSIQPLRTQRSTERLQSDPRRRFNRVLLQSRYKQTRTQAPDDYADAIWARVKVQ